MIFSTLALSSSAVFAAPTGASDKFPKRLVFKNLKVDMKMVCVPYYQGTGEINEPVKGYILSAYYFQGGSTDGKFKIGVFNNHKEEGLQVEGLGFVKLQQMQLYGEDVLVDDVLVGNFQHPASGHGYSFRTSPNTKQPVQHPKCTKENSHSGVAGQSYYSKDVTMTFARVLITQKKGDYTEIPNDPVSPDLE
jgi:hypothetical protein